jgi:hypothetical protein
MEAHARTGDIRLQKYFPGEEFVLGDRTETVKNGIDA